MIIILYIHSTYTYYIIKNARGRHNWIWTEGPILPEILCWNYFFPNRGDIMLLLHRTKQSYNSFIYNINWNISLIQKILILSIFTSHISILHTHVFCRHQMRLLYILVTSPITAIVFIFSSFFFCIEIYSNPLNFLCVWL